MIAQKAGFLAGGSAVPALPAAGGLRLWSLALIMSIGKKEKHEIHNRAKQEEQECICGMVAFGPHVINESDKHRDATQDKQRPSHGTVPIPIDAQPAGEKGECKAQHTRNVADTSALNMHNDPSSATRRTGRGDCNRSAMAGFAAAHGVRRCGHRRFSVTRRNSVSTAWPSPKSSAYLLEPFVIDAKSVSMTRTPLKVRK